MTNRTPRATGPSPTTHTLTTEDYTPWKNTHGGKWLRLRCAAEGCGWNDVYIVNSFETPEGRFAGEHGNVYTLGKAAKVEIDWTPQAYCTVCPRKDWVLLEFDDEIFVCPKCDSYWHADGTFGALDYEFRTENGIER